MRARRRGRDWGLVGVLVALAAGMAAASPHFLTAENLLGLSRHLTEAGIIACGMTVVIASGGIDLSVGSLFGLAGVAFGYAWQGGAGLAPAALVGLAVGAAGGALNGWLTAAWRLPPLIVTLATMALYRGLAMVASRAQPVSGLPSSFTWLGQGDLVGLPVQLWVWGAAVLATAAVIGHTPAGRYVRAIGDGERAAAFAGVAVDRVKLWVYSASGLLSAAAALIFTARVSTARADAGLGLELEAITAVVLGGTAITGGRANPGGSLLGVLILGVIRNGFTLAGVSTVWQSMLAGAILVATAILNQRLAERPSPEGTGPPAAP
ncbi:MAG: ABC transporter permease [Gemmatimonadota bacterium]